MDFKDDDSGLQQLHPLKQPQSQPPKREQKTILYLQNTNSGS